MRTPNEEIRTISDNATVNSTTRANAKHLSYQFLILTYAYQTTTLHAIPNRCHLCSSISTSHHSRYHPIHPTHAFIVSGTTTRVPPPRIIRPSSSPNVNTSIHVIPLR